MYFEPDKLIILEMLENNDFDVKNSVIEYNVKTGHSLSRNTVYEWIEKDDFFKTEYDIRRKMLLDEAENMHRVLRVGIPIKDEDTGKVIAWQEKPDRAAIEFFLKTKGKDRGYVETVKTDITTNGKEINQPQNLTIAERESIISEILKNGLK